MDKKEIVHFQYDGLVNGISANTYCLASMINGINETFREGKTNFYIY